MTRGELYLVKNPTSSKDPKNSRVFVIVSRDSILHTQFPTVI